MRTPAQSVPAFMPLRLAVWCLIALALLAGSGAARAAALGNLWLVGDSITSGFTVAGAYRPRLYTDLTARGDTFKFVGSATNDSTTLLNQAGQNHQEGHSGYAIATARNSNGSVRQGIYDNVNAYYASVLATQGRPDSILLMIGTNDIHANIDPSNAPLRLESLDPTAHLFVASIAPAQQGNLYMDPGVADLPAAIRTYNAAIPGIVAQHVALGQNVTFVDLYAALSLSDLGSDGLHPSAGIREDRRPVGRGARRAGTGDADAADRRIRPDRHLDAPPLAGRTRDDPFA